MANFKFNPDLFLEVAELERFKKFLDTDGFRKNILENTVKFGLVKNSRELAFTNARVERGLDAIAGQKTLKVSEIKAINNEGLFIYSSGLTNIIIPEDGSWYWLKIKHQYTSQEVGTVSLAINGDVTGFGTKFTQVLRGMPNFPSRVKFINSSFNTLEYDILEVIDDTHMIVAHPASSGTGVATFNLEENLGYLVVGTFTPGIAIPTNNKFPFQYDSVLYELVKETINNTRPSYSEGQDFLIARVKVSGSEVLIQDKRIELWETKGSYSDVELDLAPNPLIGIEAIKWQNTLSPSDKNEVYVAWGMRSLNWSINSAQNVLTLLGSSLGGKFKTTTDFTDGDFDEWRVYTSNGNYSRVITSVKQGQAINLTLDILDIDNYSNDGGLSFNSTEYVLVVPDCEEVELLFQANSTDSQENTNNSFCFPVNTLIARCDIEVYKDPSCLYNVQYRCKSSKSYTEYALIPDDSVGYYTEASFNSNGTLKDVLDRVLYPYNGSLTTGFIQLMLSLNSYSRFKGKVYIGDVVGINTVGSLDGSSVYNLEVGSSEKYQLFSNNLTLVNNLYISLSDAGAIEGNSFKFHFKGVITLGVYKIFIVRDYLTGTPVTIKTIESRDVVEVNNRLDGIVVDVYFSDQGKWDTFYQNYDYTTSTDAANVKKTGNQTIADVKTFSSSPIVPDPTTDAQAASKKYVDDSNETNVKIEGDQTVADVKTFSSSPIIPTPTADMQAAPKKYIDDLDAKNVKTEGAQTITDVKTFTSSPIVPEPTQPAEAAQLKNINDATAYIGSGLIASLYLDPVVANSYIIKDSILVKAITVTWNVTFKEFDIYFYSDLLKTQLLDLSQLTDFAIAGNNDITKRVNWIHISTASNYIRINLTDNDYTYLKLFRSF